jgi:hypothetical protein
VDGDDLAPLRGFTNGFRTELAAVTNGPSLPYTFGRSTGTSTALR